MSTENLIIFLLTNLFRTYIIRKFCIIFFEEPKEKRWRERVTYIVFFLITSLGYFLFRNPVINIISNLLGLLIIVSSYSGNKKKKFTIVFLIYGINMFCDVVIMISFPDYGIKKEINQLQGTLTVLFIWMCQILIKRFVTVKKDLEIIFPQWRYLLLIPVCSIGMIHYLITTSLLNRKTILIEGMGLLIINIITFYLYNAMEEAYAEKIDKEVAEQQMKVYVGQLDIIMGTQEKIRSLQHDMKYHIRELRAKAEAGGGEEIILYLQQMDEYMQNPDEFVYSGNKDLDGNLNYMLQKAQRLLNNVKISVKIPENIVGMNFDLNVIISNLLENAIEAALNTAEKELDIEIYSNGNLLFLIVTNSYDGQLRQMGKEFITRKKEMDIHGYGLKNVKKIVKKYNGKIDISFTEKVFKVDIMIYLQNVE